MTFRSSLADALLKLLSLAQALRAPLGLQAPRSLVERLVSDAHVDHEQLDAPAEHHTRGHDSQQQPVQRRAARHAAVARGTAPPCAFDAAPAPQRRATASRNDAHCESAVACCATARATWAMFAHGDVCDYKCPSLSAHRN